VSFDSSNGASLALVSAQQSAQIIGFDKYIIFGLVTVVLKAAPGTIKLLLGARGRQMGFVLRIGSVLVLWGVCSSPLARGSAVRTKLK